MKIMSKKFEVSYSLGGTITIEAETPEEAEELLLNSDYTSTNELFKGVETAIGICGNDAIAIVGVYESSEK